MKKSDMLGITNWPPIVRSWAKGGVVVALLGPAWGPLLAFVGGFSFINPISVLGIGVMALTLNVPDWVCDQLRVTPAFDAIWRALVYVAWNVAIGGGGGALLGLLIARGREGSHEVDP